MLSVCKVVQKYIATCIQIEFINIQCFFAVFFINSFDFSQLISGDLRQNQIVNVLLFVGKQQKRTRTKREDIVSAAAFIMRTWTR